MEYHIYLQHGTLVCWYLPKHRDDFNSKFQRGSFFLKLATLLISSCLIQCISYEIRELNVSINGTSFIVYGVLTSSTELLLYSSTI